MPAVFLRCARAELSSKSRICVHDASRAVVDSPKEDAAISEFLRDIMGPSRRHFEHVFLRAPRSRTNPYQMKLRLSVVKLRPESQLRVSTSLSQTASG